MNFKQVVLAASAVTLLATAPAMAAGLGPHAVSGTGNHCKICHDTAQSSPVLRGWAGGSVPAGIADPEWSGRPLSMLCYMCHESGGGSYGGHDMSANAYAGASHGNTIATLPEGPDNASQNPSLVASGLPYTAATKTNLECTTCHNVHRDDSRPAPFMQRNTVLELCDECHTGRNNSTPLRRFANTMAGTRSYSTHPVNINIVNTGNANINIKAVGVGTPVTTTIAAAPNYALGGHTTNATGNGGTLNCGTCHAVHGPTLGSPGVNDLLSVDNTTGTLGSELCEICHDGGIGSLSAVGAILSSDHPIDNEIGGAFYPGTVAVPTAWTVGGGQVDRGAQPFFTTGVTGTPTCSTCHDAHGGVNNTPLLRYPQPGAAPNVFNYGEWCWACHTAAGISPLGHHTNTGNWGTSQLICNDCHGNQPGNAWTAHNGFWSFPIVMSGTDSAFCEGCHTNTNPRLLISPAFPTTKNKTLVVAAAVFPASHGTLRDGVGVAATGSSHQVDMPANGTNSNIVAKATAWASSLGFSEWGAGAINPICESCHNILVNGDGIANATLTSGWQSNLLLQPYEDNMPGVAQGEGMNDFYASYAQGAGPTGEALCRGCHTGQGGNAADYVHEPAVHTRVSATFTYVASENFGNRTTNSVLAPAGGGAVGDCPNRTIADAAGAPNTTSYPATNALDCDSCHRPHNADNDSQDGNRYLILELANANQQGTTICTECHDFPLNCGQ